MPSLSLANLTNFYLLSTIVLFTYTFYEVYKKSDNYFSAILIYMDDVITNFICYNLIFALNIIFYKLYIFIFFVEVKENQTIKMVDKLKTKIIDVFLFCYILEGEIDINSFVCIIFIFFSYVIHEMAILRADFLANTPVSLSLNLNYRLTLLFLIIAFIDFQIIKHSYDLVYSQKPTYFIFIYYQILISMSLIYPMLKYFIDFYEKYTLTHIHNTDENLAVCNLIISVPRLIIQICLAICLAVKFSIFFYLIFTIIQLVSELSNTIKSYNRIKKLTETMKNLKKIGQDQIKQHHDNTCMVCFQDMTQAALLPCKHFFHQDCLKQWIIKNSNHFCPKCKKEFNFDNKLNQNDKEKEKEKTNQLHEARRRQGLDKQRIKKNKDRFKHYQKYEEKMEKQRKKREKNTEKQQKENKKMRKQIQGDDYQYQMVEKDSTQNKIKRQDIPLNNYPYQKKQQKFLNTEKQQVPSRKQQFSSSVKRTKQEPISLFSLDIPLQIVEQQTSKYVRVGSMPFGMPTEAIYHRTHRHMYIREKYQQTNEQLLLNFTMKDNRLLLMLD